MELTTETKNYTLSIISRDEIPEDIFLCERTKEKEWELIHQYEFSNGFKFIIGSNFPHEDFKDVVETLKFDYEMIKDLNSASELQQFYYHNFDNFIKYEDCDKIFNYIKKWSSQIEEILKEYETS
jgi:hypothetical protein